MDTERNKIIEADYNGSLLTTKKFSIDDVRVMDEYLAEIGYNTRVVAFFDDKSEFREEIIKLKLLASKEINRYNLRIGIVTDKELL